MYIYGNAGCQIRYEFIEVRKLMIKHRITEILKNYRLKYGNTKNKKLDI